MAGRRDVLGRLRQGGLVGDGAMRTVLAAHGLAAGACGEEWNLTRPGVMLAVHRGYVEAGAEVLLTNTFGATRCRLARAGLASRVAEINRRAVELARQAAGHDRFVLGDVGPAGLAAPSPERVERRDCFEAYCEQARILAEAGCDALLIETQVALAEAELALGAARNESDLPVGVSFVFRRGADGRYRTLAGEELSRAAERLAALEADFLGTNCCDDLESTIEATRLLRAATCLPIVVRPNAGVPRVAGNHREYPETPEEFARRVPELWAAGAACVGGCCGTTAAHVRAIAACAAEGEHHIRHQRHEGPDEG